MSAARAAILGRIASALADVPADEAAQWPGPGTTGMADAYRRAPAPGTKLLDLFVSRAGDYRAEVVRCGGDDAVAREVLRACRRHGAAQMLTARGVPTAWLSTELTWVFDPAEAPLPLAELDSTDGVLSGARVAIAETGTIALDHGPDQGRRALTLVPDLHVCVVRSEQVVATVPEGLARLRGGVERGRPITLVSGPSATSDIELERVEGVHGPRRLVVLLRE